MSLRPVMMRRLARHSHMVWRSLSSSAARPAFNFNNNRSDWFPSETLLSEIFSRDAGNDFQYEEVMKNFSWEIPEYWNFSRDVIDKFANSAG